MNRTQILSENERRHIRPEYDPVRGIGAYGERRKVSVSDVGEHYLPVSFLEVPWVKRIVKLGSIKAYCEKYDMSDMYEGVCREWILERCRHDCEYWMATFAKIKIKNKSQDDVLIPSKTQRKVLYDILDDWYAEKPVRFIVVKCRQAFITTIVTAFNTWVQLNIFENWNSLVCGDVENQATNVRGMQDKMIKGIPHIFTATGSPYEIAPFEGSSKTRIIKQRNCRISTGSMQKPENVRSADNMSCHCLTGKIELITENGFTKFVEDIQIGDVLYTHNGNKTIVKNKFITPFTNENGNGRTVVIKPWLSEPLEITPNHPVFTKRGWVNASELTKSDFVSIPIRKISDKIKYDILPSSGHRKHGGGKISKFAGCKVHFTKELGFAFGYYLAEGSIKYNGKNPCAVVFTRHLDESDFAEEANKGICNITTKRVVYQKKNTFAINEIFYGNTFAKYVINTLGTKEHKKIPDWFFDCGEDFLRGVLKGYLCGDGSKKETFTQGYECSYVISRSISQSISIQIRDIALALGYGLSSLKIMDGGVRYNRNCRKIYSLSWSGSSARKIRNDFFNVQYNSVGHKFTEKYHIENGYVWINIRSIEHGVTDKIYDIEVEHEDHSFRTISCSLKNCTEVGLWKTTLGKTPEDLIQAIRGGMDDVAYTVFGMESSPKGVGNYFYDQWILAKKGLSDLKAIFLPWYWVDRYSKKITNLDEFFLSWEKHEKKDYIDYLWSLGCTLENLNWYMDKMRTMEHWRVQSEWPSDDVEAFQSTGSRVFPLLHVNKRRQECIEPTERCDIEADEAKGPDALKNIRLGSLSQNLSIWSRPDVTVNIKYRYVVAVDIGKGKSTGSDYSVITVIDRYERMYGGADEIAAEWYGKIDIDLLAWKAAQISTFYNNALLVIEKNTIDTNTEYSKVLLSEIGKVYSNLYHTVSIDKIKGTKRITWGWHTNSSTKPVIVANMQAALRDDLYYERNKNACNEMDTYELKEDGTFGAADKCHDDLVMTRAIGLFVSSKMPVPEEVSEKSEVHVKKVVGYSSM